MGGCKSYSRGLYGRRQRLRLGRLGESMAPGLDLHQMSDADQNRTWEGKMQYWGDSGGASTLAARLRVVISM